MPDSILGIHHVTAIIGDPQPNIDFYTGVLGLRMVKLTVNYDDPGTYHLYFGDRTGRPGTAITFFPWPRAPKGRAGHGQVIATAYAVPRASLDYWADRLERNSVETLSGTRMGEAFLSLSDPDDLRVELIATDALPDVEPWDRSEVPVEQAIHGFHSVTLSVASHGPTVEFLRDSYGFRDAGEEGERMRLETAAGGPGALVDVQASREHDDPAMGPGTVHHVAWRVADDESQKAWRTWLIDASRRVTTVKDRNYFRSIYFREPGGVIFEIATDGPGMTVDEDEAHLGTELQLPPFARNMREQIMQNLPTLQIPARR